MKDKKQKPALLVVGDYTRKDFLQNFEKLRGQFSLFFLEYSYTGELKNSIYKEYGEAIFWKDFFSAQHLITKIKPSAVVFFFIEALNHVALLDACKHAGIKTYHLEHGLRDLDFQLHLKNQGLSFDNSPKSRHVPLYVKLRNRLFFELTRFFLPSGYKNFLAEYKKVRLHNSILDTFLTIKNGLRNADHYISFAPGVFKFHQRLDGLSDQQEVSFIGLPYFDYIKNDLSRSFDPYNKKVVFVDSAFHLQDSYGWTTNTRLIFLKKLNAAVGSAGFELWIKKHPLDHSDFWNGENWHIIEQEEWFSCWKDFHIVLGEYSTLMIPLAVLAHTICFCFETHPVGGYKTSGFLVDGGVCDEIENPGNIAAVLKNPEQLREIHQRHSFSKENFLKNWLTFLDGTSTQRFSELIISGATKQSNA
jgi:hypothetical protein